MEITGVELAKRAGVSKQTVYKSDLRRTPSGKFNTEDPEVKAYVEGRRRRNHAQRNSKQRTSDHGNTAVTSHRMKDLEAQIATIADPQARLEAMNELEKLRWTEARRRGQELRNARERQDLIHVKDMRQWIGFFASGLRTNILPLGDRIARGDKQLRDRIERETTKAITATLKNAAAQLRAYGETLEELDDEKNDTKARKKTTARSRKR